MRKVTSCTLGIVGLLLVGVLLAQDAGPQQTKEYCLVVGHETITGKVKVSVDFGTQSRYANRLLKGADGKPIKFESMVVALNYMNADGWEFVSAYPVSMVTGGSVYHYLMQRRAE